MASRVTGNIDPYHIPSRTGYCTITHRQMKPKDSLEPWRCGPAIGSLQNGSTEFCTYMTNGQTAGVE
jgi:hypothetical protein